METGERQIVEDPEGQQYLLVFIQHPVLAEFEHLRRRMEEGRRLGEEVAQLLDICKFILLVVFAYFLIYSVVEYWAE